MLQVEKELNVLAGNVQELICATAKHGVKVEAIEENIVAIKADFHEHIVDIKKDVRLVKDYIFTGNGIATQVALQKQELEAMKKDISSGKRMFYVAIGGCATGIIVGAVIALF